jgi:hypothetical protein
MKKSIFFLWVGLFVFFCSSAFAQLTLDKREIKLDVSPGDQVTGSITVSNPSKRDITVKTYFEDFTYTAPYLGFKTLLPLDSTERSCGKWITMSMPMFIVPSKGNQEVSYTIKVPLDAKGGYYAVVLFEKGAEAFEAEKGLGLIERAGCAFFIETRDKVKKSQVDDILVTKDGIQGTLGNLGNVILISQGTYYIMDNKGVVADRGVINTYYLPAGEKTPFTVHISNQVPAGKYTLVINFDSGEGKALVKEVDISKGKTGGINILTVRD